MTAWVWLGWLHFEKRGWGRAVDEVIADNGRYHQQPVKRKRFRNAGGGDDQCRRVKKGEEGRDGCERPTLA